MSLAWDRRPGKGRDPRTTQRLDLCMLEELFGRRLFEAAGALTAQGKVMTQSSALRAGRRGWSLLVSQSGQGDY